ncbi:hypothetical protein NTH44_003906 [Vibrio metoecus]
MAWDVCLCNAFS